MKKKVKTKTRTRSYRLLTALLLSVILLAAVFFVQMGAEAAIVCLLYGVAAALPLSLLASALTELCETERARRAHLLLQRKKQDEESSAVCFF